MRDEYLKEPSTSCHLLAMKSADVDAKLEFILEKRPTACALSEANTTSTIRTAPPFLQMLRLYVPQMPSITEHVNIGVVVDVFFTEQRVSD